jgi:hypothetical protein
VGKKVKQNRSWSEVVKAEHSMEQRAGLHHVPNEEWIARIGELQNVLSVCPTDILAGSELATLLEQLGQLEEALCHWNMVLARDPNSLNAREGVARCRMSHPLQPGL